MKQLARAAWRDLVTPVFRRPAHVQIAALCYRQKKSTTEVLLVQSSAGNWILPKGWPIDGLGSSETAMQEAWEEAGVRRGKPASDAIGSYPATKILSSGVEVPCVVHVYPVKVKELAPDFPEADCRNPTWHKPKKAMKLIDNDGLRAVIEQFSQSL